MQKISIITKLLVLLVLGVFIYGIAQYFDPLDIYYKYRDEKRKSDLQQVQIALEQFYDAHDHYPESTGNNIQPCEGDNLIKHRNPNTKEVEPVRWGTKWFGWLEPMPKDTDLARCYVYAVSPSLQSYWLYASLDRGTKDTDACGVAGVQCDNLLGNNLLKACKKAGVSGEHTCNYGVSSSNESL